MIQARNQGKIIAQPQGSDKLAKSSEACYNSPNSGEGDSRMPELPNVDFEAIGTALQMLAMWTGAVLTAFWLGLVVWTFRDIRSRSRDMLTVALSVVLVLVLNILGLALYLLLRPKETLAEKYGRTLEEKALLQGIETHSLCPNCQAPVEHDFIICPACQTRVRRPCHHCGRLLQLDWQICPYCAEPVPGMAELATPVAGSPVEGNLSRPAQP